MMTHRWRLERGSSTAQSAGEGGCQHGDAGGTQRARDARLAEMTPPAPYGLGSPTPMTASAGVCGERSIPGFAAAIWLHPGELGHPRPGHDSRQQHPPHHLGPWQGAHREGASTPREVRGLGALPVLRPREGSRRRHAGIHRPGLV